VTGDAKVGATVYATKSVGYSVKSSCP
jgi:hypothetical protein